MAGDGAMRARLRSATLERGVWTDWNGADRASVYAARAASYLPAPNAAFPRSLAAAAEAFCAASALAATSSAVSVWTGSLRVGCGARARGGTRGRARAAGGAVRARARVELLDGLALVLGLRLIVVRVDLAHVQHRPRRCARARVSAPSPLRASANADNFAPARGRLRPRGTACRRRGRTASAACTCRPLCGSAERSAPCRRMRTHRRTRR